MSALAGVGLALAVFAGAAWAGFSRDRSFYPAVLIVTASYGVLFAVQAQARAALLLEMVAMALFMALAVVGFRTSAWVVVAALVLHGAFDMVHDALIDNAGMPAWWPLFCWTFDMAMGACLAVAMVVKRRRRRAHGAVGRRHPGGHCT
jgi:hypothetical protein